MNNAFHKLSQTQEILCLIPTLNESTAVAEVIAKAHHFAHRVVVVDGHSDDGTPAIASEAGADVIIQEGKGKGMALRTAFTMFEADIYVIIDGDATYDVLEMDKLVQPVLDGEADMVIGSRLKGTLEDGAIPWVHKVGNDFFNFLINILFHGSITDSQSGYRALNRKAVESLHLSSQGFEVETEMTMKALKQGLKIKDVPITYRRRRGSQSKLHSFTAGFRILLQSIAS
ncbi:glycosyltransferase family 2 protein [Candidatus Bathyarchaeota archaeon]|nr:glycosyltransferase family 2 protein [Candidatus Bathyarchaeota archaeon]